MDKYDTASELLNMINSCLMPELKVNVGDEHITSEHFNEFRKILDANLTIIFDRIQANESLLNEDDSNFGEFQVRLILLLCEQSSTYSYQWHQTKNQKLLDNIKRLISKYFKNILFLNDRKIEVKVFDYYKSKLVASVWKRSVGSVIGFLEFLDLRYNIFEGKIEKNEATFILSVGLLLQDFFDPTFKEMGIKIFNIILNRTNKEYLIQMNIHNVIFEELRKDVYKLDSHESIDPLWNNLILCLKIKDFKYSYIKFTEVDFLIKDLCHQIVVARSVEIWIELMKILIKIFLEFSLNTSNVKRMISDKEDNILENILEIREICRVMDPGIAYRWAKTILECLVAVSNYLLGISNRTIQVLNIFHLCYLIWVLPMDLNICDNLLEIFFKKFSAVLMEAIRLNKTNILVCDGIKEFIKTFIYHIKIQEQNLKDDSKIKEYICVFEEIILCIDNYVNI